MEKIFGFYGLYKNILAGETYLTESLTFTY